MILRVLIICIGVLTFGSLSAQEERGIVREGNSLYERGRYERASEQYQEALEVEENLIEGKFNLGNAYYMMDSFELASKEYKSVISKAPDNATRAQAFHNLGNAYLKQAEAASVEGTTPEGQEKYKAGIEAFKNALRLNPQDKDTKYNLQYAQGKIIVEPPQDSENQQDQKDGDEEDNKPPEDNEDGQKGDKESEQEDKESEEDAEEEKEGNPDGGEKGDKSEEEGQEEMEEQKRPEKEEQKREEALQRALDQKEKELMEQLMIQDVPAPNRNIEKDW